MKKKMYLHLGSIAISADPQTNVKQKVWTVREQGRNWSNAAKLFFSPQRFLKFDVI